MKEIWGHEIEAKVGGRVMIDGRTCGSDLLPGVEPEQTEGGFKGSQFVISTGRDFGVRQLAVNIEVTGRTIKYIERGLSEQRAVRCRIIIVGDGEPNTAISGWLYI